MMLSSNALSVIVAAALRRRRRRQVAKWQSGSKSELQFVQQEQPATRRGWK